MYNLSATLLASYVSLNNSYYFRRNEWYKIIASRSQYKGKWFFRAEPF